MFEANRNIDDLIPEMAKRVRKWASLCKEAGIDILITETKRAKDRQFWLWAKGRVITKQAEINYLGYDDPRIDSQTGEKQVTWTLQSNHLKGEAIDFVFLKDGAAWWSAPDSLWEKAYDIAESVGLQSLYRMKGLDRPHLEYNHNWTMPEKTAHQKETEEATAWVKTLGISNGDRPSDNISRGDFWITLKRFADKCGLKF